MSDDKNTKCIAAQSGHWCKNGFYQNSSCFHGKDYPIPQCVNMNLLDDPRRTGYLLDDSGLPRRIGVISE